VAYWALAGYTRLCLVWLEGTSANGLFSIGDRFGVLVTLAVTAVQLAWNELLFSSADASPPARRARQTRALISGTLASAMTLMVTIAAVFDTIISSDYAASEPLVPILLAAAAANGAANFLNGLFMQTTQTRPILVTTGAGAAANLILSPALILHFGAMGAAGGLALSFLLVLAMRMARAGRALGCPVWSTGLRIQLVLLLTVVGSVAAEQLALGAGLAVIAAAVFLGALRQLMSGEEETGALEFEQERTDREAH
jgi:O-antigen/teichoic acid export membrane protein